MNFPEKPIATAGLGIVCALALLAFLSWPGFFGNSLGGSSFPPSGNVAGTTQLSSTTNVVSSITTVSNAEPANYSLGGVAKNISTPSSTVTSIVSSVAQVTTVQSATTITGTVAITQPVYGAGSSQSAFTASSTSSSYLTFTILAVLSVVIAVGSMLFMKRRITAE